VSLIDVLTQQLGGNAVQQMSTQLGSDPSTTQSAISVALPLILSGLAREASNPNSATSLGRALDQDHDGSVLDNASALFGNPGASSGAGILGHIFGAKQAPVQQGVSKASGLSPQQTTQLLMMLAPLVMGALGRMKKQQGVDAGGLGQVLQQEQQDIARRAPSASGLGGLLDQNNDGSMVDDIVRMGPGLLGGLFGGGRR